MEVLARGHLAREISQKQNEVECVYGMMKPNCLGWARLIVLASAVAACSSARADSWSSPAEVKETTNVFGLTKVVLRYDGVTRRNHPQYSVKICREEKLLA